MCSLCFFRSFSLSLSLSFLLKFRDPTTVRFLIWRKASSICQTISSHLSRPITPGPPKVLPTTTTTSPRSSRSLLHSFAFNVYRCFFFFFLDLRTYLMDLIDVDSMRGLGLCWSETISYSLCAPLFHFLFFFSTSASSIRVSSIFFSVYCSDFRSKRDFFFFWIWLFDWFTVFQFLVYAGVRNLHVLHIILFWNCG